MYYIVAKKYTLYSMAENKPFRIPPALLSQLNECSNGAFALCVFNDEGDAYTYWHFDSQMHRLALLTQLKNWTNSMMGIDQSNMSSVISSIDRGEPIQEDESDDFGDEDPSDEGEEPPTNA